VKRLMIVCMQMVNRFTPAATTHSLLLEQLMEGTSWNSTTDTPSIRCQHLGFDTAFDSLVYMLSEVSATGS